MEYENDDFINKRINAFRKRKKIKRRYILNKKNLKKKNFGLIIGFFIILLSFLFLFIKIKRKKKLLIEVDVSKSKLEGGGPIQLQKGISKVLPYETKNCEFISSEAINSSYPKKPINYYFNSYPMIRDSVLAELISNKKAKAFLLGPNFVPSNWNRFPNKKYYRDSHFREILLSIKALIVHSNRVRDHLAGRTNTTDLLHKFILLRACTYSMPTDIKSFIERNIDIILYEKYPDSYRGAQGEELFRLFEEKNKTIQKLKSGYYRREHLKNLASKSKFVIYFSFYDTGAIALKEIQNYGVIAFCHQKDFILSRETAYYIPELEDKDIKNAFNKIMKIIDNLTNNNVDSKKIAIMNQNNNKCEKALDDICDGLMKSKS